MIQVFQLLLSLSILVVLHELGHYLAAKYFGCRVEKFYLFMDWGIGGWDGALFKKKIGETEFGVGWAPLGGYVKISGFIDESLDDSGVESEPESWELRAKPAWQRLIVMLGGIFINLVLAWAIYSFVLFGWGERFIPMKNLVDGFSFNEGGELLGFVDGDKITKIDGVMLTDYDPMFVISSVLFEGASVVSVKRNNINVDVNIESSSVNKVISNMQQYEGDLISPNYRWVVDEIFSESPLKDSALKPGDCIVSINNEETPFINSNSRNLLQSNSGKEVVIGFKKNNSSDTEYTTVLVPESGLLGVGVMGNYFENRSYSFLKSIPAGLNKTLSMIKMYWGQVKTIFNPSTGGYKHVGGVISIGKMFPGNWNWLAFWSMTALLSIILAIMNLLPIPALDGGHAVIALIEMFSGKKLPLSVLMPLQITGMVILFAILIYANGMDIFRLLN